MKNKVIKPHHFFTLILALGLLGAQPASASQEGGVQRRGGGDVVGIDRAGKRPGSAPVDPSAPDPFGDGIKGQGSAPLGGTPAPASPFPGIEIPKGLEKEVDKFFKDPTLSLEAKLLLFLYLAQQKLEDQIESEIEKLNDMQKGGGGESGESEDVRIHKIKELTSQKAQLQDAVQAAIMQIDQDTESVVQSIGR